MKRSEAIKEIMSTVDEEDVVVSSCGMISRELYEYQDRPRNFYVMGSMGAPLGLGLGIALERPDLDVVVIAGDGDILMSLSTLVLLNLKRPDNFTLYILDNNCYASTGGQKTCSHAIDFYMIAPCVVYPVSCEKGDAPRIPLRHEDIARRFMNAISR